MTNNYKNDKGHITFGKKEPLSENFKDTAHSTTDAETLIDQLVNKARGDKFLKMYTVNWTTEKPTEPGWYFVYGKLIEEYSDNNIQVTIAYVDKDEHGFFIEGAYEAPVYFEQKFVHPSSMVAYTHFAKIKLPEPPK